MTMINQHMNSGFRKYAIQNTSDKQIEKEKKNQIQNTHKAVRTDQAARTCRDCKVKIEVTDYMKHQNPQFLILL